jgi:hypothetical protein
MYTVVGLFDTADEASKAAEIIRKIVVDVVDWYDQRRRPGVIFEDQQSPVEQRVAEQYQFEWKESVDWLVRFPRYFFEPFQREPAEHIYLFDRLVIVDAPGASSTNQTGHQFSSLIHSLNGQSYRHIYEGHDTVRQTYVWQTLYANLQCKAPDEETAVNIFAELDRHLNDRATSWKLWHPIPWIVHHPDLQRLTGNKDNDYLRTLEQTWIEDHQEFAEWLDTPEHSEEQRKAKRPEIMRLDQETDSIIHILRSNATIGEAMIERANTLLKIENLTGNFETLHPALRAWLQSLGCTDITYTFHDSDLKTLS